MQEVDSSREPPPPLPVPGGILPIPSCEVSKAGATQLSFLVCLHCCPQEQLPLAGLKLELETLEAGLLCGFNSSSDDADLQLQAARKLRGLLSSHREFLIQEVDPRTATINLIPTASKTVARTQLGPATSWMAAAIETCCAS